MSKQPLPHKRRWNPFFPNSPLNGNHTNIKHHRERLVLKEWKGKWRDVCSFNSNYVFFTVLFYYYYFSDIYIVFSSHILFYMDIPTVPLVPRLSDSGRCIFWETAQQHSTALVLKCSAQHLIKTERFKRATTSALCICANAAATSVGCSYPWCFLTYFCRSTSF